MDVRVVDCRFDLADPPAARRRYLDAHIPGAAFLELEADLSDMSIPPEIGGRHPLPGAEQFAAAAGRAGIGASTLAVSYDESGTGGAARLWWLLRHFGHDLAGALDRGLRSWLGPLADGEEAIEPAVFTARERRDDVVTTEELEDRLGDPRLVLLDARPEDRYRGDVLGPDPLPGHIPGARHVMLSGDPASLPADVLETDEVVCYCGSGVAACVPLLALHRAGRTDARLYPGSWSEWSRKGLPAET